MKAYLLLLVLALAVGAYLYSELVPAIMRIGGAL